MRTLALHRSGRVDFATLTPREQCLVDCVISHSDLLRLPHGGTLVLTFNNDTREPHVAAKLTLNLQDPTRGEGR